MFAGEEITKGPLKEAIWMPTKKPSLDAERISRILESCIHRVELAASMPSILQFYSESGVEDQQLSGLLEAHQILEQRLKKLEDQVLTEEQEKGAEGESRRKKRTQLKESIKDSVSDVLRFFQSHPNALADVKQLGLDEGESEIVKMLKKFYTYLMEKELPSLEEKPQVVKKQKTPCIIELMPEEEGKIKQLDDKILEINNAIHDLERYLQVKVKSPNSERKVKPSPLTGSEEMERAKHEADKLKAQLKHWRLKNGHAEDILLERNQRLKKETVDLLQKFDKDMAEIQIKLDMNFAEFEREQEAIKNLEMPFSVLEEEYNQITERRRLEEEKQRKEIERVEKTIKAAFVIQRWWRKLQRAKAKNIIASAEVKKKTKKAK